MSQRIDAEHLDAALAIVRAEALRYRQQIEAVPHAGRNETMGCMESLHRMLWRQFLDPQQPSIGGNLAAVAAVATYAMASAMSAPAVMEVMKDRRANGDDHGGA